jgi:N-glycosylase/DNA lyase
MKTLYNRDFNISHIASSGQCFRWNKVNENTYSFIAFGEYCEISVDKNGILSISNPSYLEGLKSDYLDFSTDYSFIKAIADKEDEYLQAAINKFGDIVILRQDLWEIIVSFIISQRKSIPAIKTCIEKLCEKFGNEILLDNGNIKYAFPTPESIQSATLKELNSCGIGYRDKYIKTAANWFLDTPEHKRTKESVLDIYGVGNKVGNCIGLFGLHDLSCCPIDVWMKKIIDRRYNGIQPNWMQSEFAGVYQQYVFMYERSLAKEEHR